LWGRFGTPTPRSLSGTLEEFERAYSRLNDINHCPEVMIYFKDAPLPPSKIDTSQLQHIQDFRTSLSSRGGYYSVFESEADFQSSLRAHLATLAQKFSKVTTEKHSKNLSTIASIEDLLVDEDDLGYFDYAEIFDSRMNELTSTFGVMSDATERVGHQMTLRTEEIQKLDLSTLDSKTARRHIKRAADDMEAYAIILSQQLPLMSSSREAAFQALSKGLTLYDDFSEPDRTGLTHLYTTLTGLSAATKTPSESLTEFRSTIFALPRMTSDLNKAKRAVTKQLDLILDELGKTAYTIDNILESIDRMLQRGKMD
jgi:uncharacterized protein YjgD (DUF1641 family)